MRSALLLALLLWAVPSVAADDAWSDSDVEAAERYRTQERERADRYRARIEARAEAPAPRAAAEPRPRPGGSGTGLDDRIAARLRAWFEGVLADLVRALADALRSFLHELVGTPPEDRAEATRRELAPSERRGLGAWLQREQSRADDWLEGRPGADAPAPESLREWQRREAERARELARREEKEARERARRNARLEREARERAEWEERWRDADAWWVEERARLEGRAGD